MNLLKNINRVLFTLIFLFFAAIPLKSQSNCTFIDSLLDANVDIAVLDIKEILPGSGFVYENDGVASWYGKKFHNRKTASGEIFNMYDFTAAHKDLPFGTIIKVHNKDNNRVAFVRVNDRGPFKKRRIIDLSYASEMLIDGKDLNEVEISAFLPNQDVLDALDDYDYYLAHSSNFPSLCMQKQVMTFVACNKDLNEIITLFSNSHKKFPEKAIFFVVPAKQMKSKKCEKFYYLAVLSPFMMNKYSDMLFKDDHKTTKK